MSYEYRFVVMDGHPADYAEKFRAACRHLDLPTIVETFPHIFPMEFSRQKLKHIRELLRRRHPREIVGFCPGALELFVDEADVRFCFSSYEKWHDPRHTKVIAHPWSPVRPNGSGSPLRWAGKPPLNIGFMGSTYETSRTARLVANGPAVFRKWLKEGGLVRNVDRVAWLDEHRIPHRYLPTFARFQALHAIARAHRRHSAGLLEIVDTFGFNGSELQVRDFADHLERMTYVICPRGCENYSFRLFEALRFGRIPVIIDSDMVLPSSIDWEKVAIIVPFERVGEAYDRIVADHRERSVHEFIDRQDAALALGARLADDSWLAEEIRQALEALGLCPENAQSLCVA